MACPEKSTVAAARPFIVVARALAVLSLLAAAGGCSSVAPDTGVPQQASYFAAAPSSALGELAARALATHPRDSLVRVLDTGRDALLERSAMIETAARSIDAQYYIWNSDRSGIYLASRLYAAAERGVRVRLLLDDINVAGRDAALATLDAHPNVEIRIYNPVSGRTGLARTFGLFSEFTRINRRMHNKSFTVDGALGIVGGRNIGDEYFDANPELNFRDRDIVAAGPVVAATGAMFDTFWNSALSRPIVDLAQGMTLALAGSAERVVQAAGQLRAIHGELPADEAAGLRHLRQSLAGMIPARARLVYDTPPDPARFGQTSEPQPSSHALAGLSAATTQEILIESAYLVMDNVTMRGVSELTQRGLRVRALTNSLASNDVTANHAAYARRREQMLASGVDLYELRPDAASCADVVMNRDACAGDHLFGLHAKTFVFDRKTVYVGSFNLNLRSRYLNAESGVIIDSPALAASIADAIATNMTPRNSWHVVLDRRGNALWQTPEDAGGVREIRREPQTPWLRRAKSGFIALFPLEKYL